MKPIGFSANAEPEYKEVQVNVVQTIQHLQWECPKCFQENTLQPSELDDFPYCDGEEVECSNCHKIYEIGNLEW